MKWLVPLGFLGFIGLLILLLIYIIKPNFQKKTVSSTYVWKLSLKFRKRRHPINKLQNLIVLILQILSILACTLIMAQPVIESALSSSVPRKIAIIDASVSMLSDAYGDGNTRFDRAISEVRTLAKSTVDAGGEITVIVAGEKASYTTVRATERTVADLNSMLDEMSGNASEYCSRGSADIVGAMSLAEEVLSLTPRAEVIYYSGKEYIDTGSVQVKNVSDANEYNIAILDGEAKLEENLYQFVVDIASYNRDEQFQLYCEIYGINGDSSLSAKYEKRIQPSGDEVQTVIFDFSEEDDTKKPTKIYSYDYARIYFSASDSFSYDNSFYIYGGMKETIRIQYVSEIPNIYFRSSIRILRAALRSRWEIEYDEINMSLPSAREPAIEGYDIYIFERYVPRSVPTDGVVMLVSPSTTPAGIGLRNSGSTLSGNLYLSTVEDHPIIRGMIPESIVVTKCQRLDFNDSYKILLNCGRSSALAIRNDEDYRVIVMAFELQNSDFGVRLDFSRMFYQTFEYFFPHTIDRYNFEVGESVTVNARADSLKVEGQGVNLTLTDLPTQLTLSNNGTYTLTQVITPAKTVVDSIFVKIPNRESDFSTPVEELANPYIEKPNAENEDYDLLVYIASALVLFLFAEWWLQSRTQA